MEFDLYLMFEEREKMLKKLEREYKAGNIIEEEYIKKKEYIETYY